MLNFIKKWWEARRRSETPEQVRIRLTEERDRALQEHLFEDLRLQTYIEELPLRQRAVLIDHIEQGLNYKEIAQKYGLTYKIVLKDLSKAYATLRMRMVS